MPQVEGYIQRKSMLYKTGVEYGDYTLNFVQGWCAWLPVSLLCLLDEKKDLGRSRHMRIG